VSGSFTASRRFDVGGEVMTSKEAVAAPGHFRWDAGGWFGGQLGGTAWMLVGAAVLAPRAADVAAVWLACFAVPNAIGCRLWRRRGRLRPYPATQALLLACVMSGLLALAALHVMRPGLRIAQPPGVRLADEPRLVLGLLLMWGGLALTFHLLERSARERAEVRSRDET
jgi:hypothetical protein